MSGQWINFQRFAPLTVPTSPTYNLVSPAIQRLSLNDKGKEIERGPEFDCADKQVKPWEGERIHEVGMDMDEDGLELTLGNVNTRS